MFWFSFPFAFHSIESSSPLCKIFFSCRFKKPVNKIPSPLSLGPKFNSPSKLFDFSFRRYKYSNVESLVNNISGDFISEIKSRDLMVLEICFNLLLFKAFLFFSCRD